GSRAVAERLLEGGAVLVDGARRPKSHRLNGGEVVELGPQPAGAAPERDLPPLRIAHEDDEFLVVDKPAGLTVHPGAGQAGGTLVDALAGRIAGDAPSNARTWRSSAAARGRGGAGSRRRSAVTGPTRRGARSRPTRRATPSPSSSSSSSCRSTRSWRSAWRRAGRIRSASTSPRSTCPSSATPSTASPASASSGSSFTPRGSPFRTRSPASASRPSRRCRRSSSRRSTSLEATRGSDPALARVGPPRQLCPRQGRGQNVRSARDRAAVLAGVERLVAPHRLHGEQVLAELDVLRLDPGALVAVLAPGGVVPAVLVGEEVVRIGHGLGVLVAGDDAVAV